MTSELTIEHLRKPLKIGSKVAPNRLVYQPTESNNADRDGNVTDTTVEKYVELARGNPGVLFVESLDVTRETQARSNRLLILKENRKGLERLVREIRKTNGDTVVLFQLSHAGRLSDPSMKPPLYVYAPPERGAGSGGHHAGAEEGGKSTSTGIRVESGGIGATPSAGRVRRRPTSRGPSGSSSSRPSSPMKRAPTESTSNRLTGSSPAISSIPRTGDRTRTAEVSRTGRGFSAKRWRASERPSGRRRPTAPF